MSTPMPTPGPGTTGGWTRCGAAGGRGTGRSPGRTPATRGSCAAWRRWPGRPGRSVRTKRRSGAGSSSPTAAPTRMRSCLAEFGARRQQVLTGLHDASRHAGLGRLAPRARVVVLLPAGVALHLVQAVVVREHVAGHGPGKRVLHVGVHVHLHHAVGDGLADLLKRRP